MKHMLNVLQMTSRMAALCTSSQPVEVDCVQWISRCTLDIIGLAGFGYDFAALDGSRDSEMSAAVDAIVLEIARKPTFLMRMIAQFFPALVRITMRHSV
jgi:hypothetical protein